MNYHNISLITFFDVLFRCNQLNFLWGLLIFTSAPLYAQVYDTLPNMPDHYAKRLAKFRSEEHIKEKVVFLGNSITEGGQWHGLTDDINRINRGIGGDVTYGVLHRLDEILSLHPSKLFIMIGINDIGKDFPIDVIVNNYTKMVQRVRAASPETVIYIQSVLPVNPTVDGFPQQYNKGPEVVTLNNRLKQLAANMEIQFVDLYPIFTDGQAHLKASLTYDGLHLNKAGYETWIDFLTKNGYL